MALGEVVRDELFARIDAIAPTLAADIPRGDELRRLPDASVDALRRSGLLRLKVPTALGGHEAEPGLQFEVFERVAKPESPTERELAANPRSRSARLRSAVRTAAPPWKGAVQ